MMDMVNTTGPGFVFLWGLHVLSVVLFFVGILFLVLWAMKTLTPGQLKTWGIGLAVAGTIAFLLTIGLRGAPGMGFGMGKFEKGMMHGEMMDKMMDHMMDDEDSDMHRMEGDDDMMGMSMDDMSAMLEGKTGDAFDKAFIEGMIPHHQGAIGMARAAQQSAKHDEIKNMANEIILAQQREIDQMKQWQKDWGFTQ